MKALGETEAHQWLLEKLIVAISRLARPAESQIAYLDSLGSGESADELALELDDVDEAALAIPGLVSPQQRRLVRILGDELRAISGHENAELWSPKALRSAPEWTHIRELARSALNELHAESVA